MNQFLISKYKNLKYSSFNIITEQYTYPFSCTVNEGVVAFATFSNNDGPEISRVSSLCFKIDIRRSIRSSRHCN